VFGLLRSPTVCGSSRTGKVMGALSVDLIREDKELGITRGSDSRGDGGSIVGSSLKGTRTSKSKSD
jgi:hypothetical protein